MIFSMKESRRVLMTVSFLLILGIMITSTPYMPALKHTSPFSEPVKEDTSILSSSIGVKIAADMDDDWWKYSKPDGPWRHYTSSADNLVRNYTDYYAYGQMRFQLNIPSGSTIESATLSFYLVTAGAGTITIKRIEETNVGPLEQDTTIPSTTDLYSSIILPGDIENITVQSESLTFMVQDQVNLPGWQSGYYFGVQLSSDTVNPTSFADYEYMEAQFVAYMNITYLTYEEPPQQAQDYDHDLHIPVQSDVDDDWWRWNTTNDSWEHRTGGIEVVAGNTNVTNNFGQMRFPLAIPKGCTVNFATLNLYLTFNGNVTIFIKRVDEINVGPLEEDLEKPNATDVHMSTIYSGPETGWITSNNIASIIQDQINLGGWEEEYYIGLQLAVTTPDVVQTASWCDYQHASGPPAYLNVTFTSIEVGWLSDWQYRKKIVLQQTVGVGANQTIPISLWQGLGSDKGFEAHLDDHSRPDFGDVRFTSDDGQLLLRYYLNETVWGTSSEYFTNDAVSFPWGHTNTPSSFYDVETDRTYVVFQGDLTPGGMKLDPHICYYDHRTATWSGIYWIATNPLNDWHGGDIHGPPCLWVDNDGYIHVLYGSHASRVIQHEKSNEPNDITAFSPSTDPTTSAWEPTYPAIFYDEINNMVHLLYRGTNGGYGIVYQNSVDNGLTWSIEREIFAASEVSLTRPYHGLAAMSSNNQILHIAWNNHSMLPSSTNGQDHDYYYIQLDLTNYHIYNITGYDFGTQLSPSEVESCCFYDYPLPEGSRNGYPDLFLDENDNPHIFYAIGDNTPDWPTVMGPDGWTLRYTFWDAETSQWRSMNITAHEGSGNAAAALVWAHDNITIFTNSNPSDNLVHRWTWNGYIWTDLGAISVPHSYLVSNSEIPMNWRDGNRTELQVVFCDYTASYPPSSKSRCYAWGDGGILAKSEQTMAIFNVELVGNLSSLSQTIYVYYGNNVATSTSQDLGINPDPRLNLLYWGPEETLVADAPFNVREPMISNLDQESHMYAQIKEYEIEAVLSDVNGFENIEYIELSLFSDNRINEYWTIRYDQNTNSFSEQNDIFDYIELDEATSYATGYNITLTLTFRIIINWNHPDSTNTDIRCYIIDETSKVDVDYYETDWDIETRLEISSGLQIEDGIGTSDRGDPNRNILAYGNIEYLDSSIHPLASKIDALVLCTDSSVIAWEVTNYDQMSGEFSVSVPSADEVGQNTYIVKVVRQGEGAEGFNLLYESFSADYITDRVQAILSVDQAASTSEYITFRLDLEYEYDHESVDSFSVGINKNGEIWKIVDEKTFTDTRGIDDNNTYSIAFVVDEIHGLYSSTDYGSVIVLAGDGTGDSNSDVPDASNNALDSIRNLIRIVLQVSSVLVLAGFSFIESAEILVTDIQNLFFPSEFIVISILSSAILLTAFQIHKIDSGRSNKKLFEIFKKSGGLRMDTLLLSKGYSNGLFLKIGGQEFGCTVLSHDSLKCREHIQTYLVTGGKINQIIVLLSTSLTDGNAEYPLIGFVWEPMAEDMD
jgi:hypothetical protein